MGNTKHRLIDKAIANGPKCKMCGEVAMDCECNHNAQEARGGTQGEDVSECGYAVGDTPIDGVTMTKGRTT